MNTTLNKALMTGIVLGSLFQFGHFLEHFFQFLMYWIFDQKHPWMSPIADWLTMMLSKIFDKGICTTTAKPMMVGMEVLHLLGNLIFLVTMGLMLLRLNTVVMTTDGLKGYKLVKWAFIIEAIHLLEHLCLTFTILYTGKALGVSNLFGHASLWPVEYAVGYRVGFHFVMNLIPSMMLVMAWLQMQRNRLTPST